MRDPAALLLPPRVLAPSEPTLCVFVVGSLAVKDGRPLTLAWIDDLAQKLRFASVFASTYSAYAAPALRLVRGNASRVLAHTPAGTPTLETSGQYQWFHLDALLRSFAGELLQHSHALKLRPDIRVDAPLHPAALSSVTDNNFFTLSDISFYATSRTFHDVLAGFYEAIQRPPYYGAPCDTYWPINFEHMLTSDREALYFDRSPGPDVCGAAANRTADLHGIPPGDQASQLRQGDNLLVDGVRCGDYDLVFRSGLAARELVYPCSVFSQLAIKEAVSKKQVSEEVILPEQRTDPIGPTLDALRRMLDADPRALSDPKWQSAPFCNGCQAANPIFGSEKAFAHRVLKSCPVRKFTLPIVGVVR